MVKEVVVKIDFLIERHHENWSFGLCSDAKNPAEGIDLGIAR